MSLARGNAGVDSDSRMDKSVSRVEQDLKKSGSLAGRARRREYWVTFLVASGAAYAITSFAGYLDVTGDAYLLLFVLSRTTRVLICLPVSVRRLHDVGRSGWWYLVPLAIFVFAFVDGTPGSNRFGPSPKFHMRRIGGVERPMRHQSGAPES